MDGDRETRLQPHDGLMINRSRGGYTIAVNRPETGLLTFRINGEDYEHNSREWYFREDEARLADLIAALTGLRCELLDDVEVSTPTPFYRVHEPTK
jgi:hypothetical protein